MGSQNALDLPQLDAEAAHLHLVVDPADEFEIARRQPADQVASQLLADCARLGVHIPAADWVDVLQEPHAIVHTPPGHFTKTHSFAARDRNGLYFAGDWLTGSTIEGAVRSGEAAAARARETLRGRKAATSAAQPSSREPTGRR